MDSITITLIAIIIINLALTVWMIIRNRHNTVEPLIKLEALISSFKVDLISKQLEGLSSLRESFDNTSRLINDRLAESTSTLDRRMATVGEIENKLGQLSTQTKNIEDIGKNIQSLSKLLKPPKLRGNLGELLLENLLAQILPKALFNTQYRFNDGSRVDTVVRLADRLMPIDSKFPLESYRRIVSDNVSAKENKTALKEFSKTIKKHIDDIRSKYLNPEQNTTDFAVMYIPSEAVYNQFISGDDLDLFEYALSQKVIPSSPGQLYGFLASISAIYTEAGLSQNHRQLVDCINNIIESLEKVNRFNERINGSLRSASLSLDKSKEELVQMDYQLQKLHEPQLNEKTE